MALVPPPVPLQVHVKLFVPLETVDAVPALHKFALGATNDGTPLAEPHAPLTGTMSAVNVAFTVQSATTVPVV